MVFDLYDLAKKWFVKIVKSRRLKKRRFITKAKYYIGILSAPLLEVMPDKVQYSDNVCSANGGSPFLTLF
jgi:hypothetical protein